MPTKEVSRDQWIRFFDDFGRQHEGWIVTLEVIGREVFDQEEVSGLPLVGISANVKPEERVVIEAGGTPEANATRIVNPPKGVWLKKPEDTIEIEAQDGTKKVVRFQYVRPGETERQLPEEEPTKTRG